tara:strand:- start:105 stop:839 length:735 start_codon:yes stop_codon:yes gene_type:complete
MVDLNSLNVKIFLDTANLDSIKSSLDQFPFIKGFTTNPSLMHKEGVNDYEAFCKKALEISSNLPISFEVFSDNVVDMEKEARIINSWGGNSYAKIPITNTKGELTTNVIKNLTKDGIKINVTAIFTVEQVKKIIDFFEAETPSIISVFAGRIADSGIDPIEIMNECSEIISKKKNVELLWASSREILNIIHAENTNSDIITIAPDILSKIKLLNKNLDDFSLETVKDFFKDAQNAGFNIQNKDK